MPAKKKEQEFITQEVNPMIVPDKTAFTEVGQLLNVALEKGSGIETLERVMKLYEQGQEILAKQQFNQAFAAFQKELPTVKKSKTACFTTTRDGTMKYSYASMDDVVQAVQPVLHKFGLSYWFKQSQEQVQTQKEVELQPGVTETRPVTVTVINITCHLGHVSGHSLRNTVSGPMDGSGQKTRSSKCHPPPPIYDALPWWASSAWPVPMKTWTATPRTFLSKNRLFIRIKTSSATCRTGRHGLSPVATA